MPLLSPCRPVTCGNIPRWAGYAGCTWRGRESGTWDKGLSQSLSGFSWHECPGRSSPILLTIRSEQTQLSTSSLLLQCPGQLGLQQANHHLSSLFRLRAWHRSSYWGLLLKLKEPSTTAYMAQNDPYEEPILKTLT